jgi:hypothetical protein
MHYSPFFDLALPGLIYAAAGGMLAIIFAAVIIVLIESIILWRLRWGSFARSMLAGFVMNFATSVLGLGLIAALLYLGYWGLLIDFAISVLVEGGILMLFKRGAARENWKATLIVNAASYLLVILPMYLLLGLLG